MCTDLVYKSSNELEQGRDLGGVSTLAVRENGGPKQRLVSPLSVKWLR